MQEGFWFFTSELFWLLLYIISPEMLNLCNRINCKWSRDVIGLRNRVRAVHGYIWMYSWDEPFQLNRVINYSWRFNCWKHKVYDCFFDESLAVLSLVCTCIKLQQTAWLSTWHHHQESGYLFANWRHQTITLLQPKIHFWVRIPFELYHEMESVLYSYLVIIFQHLHSGF